MNRLQLWEKYCFEVNLNFYKKQNLKKKFWTDNIFFKSRELS